LICQAEDQDAQAMRVRDLQRRNRFGAVGNMPADDAHAALITLHGIGPWISICCSASGMPTQPAGDLALQEAARITFGLRKRPDVKGMAKLAEPWRPRRGVAAFAVGLLSCGQAARGRPDQFKTTSKTPAKKMKRRKNGAAVASEIDGRGSRRAEELRGAS
jgi:DNA-3-methyladenine glycosylase II